MWLYVYVIYIIYIYIFIYINIYEYIYIYIYRYMYTYLISVCACADIKKNGTFWCIWSSTRSHNHGQHFIGPGAPVPSVEDMSPLLNKSQQLHIYTWWILIFGYFWWSFRSAIWPFMAPPGSGVSAKLFRRRVRTWSLWIRIRAARHPAFSGAVGPHWYGIG